MKQKVLATMLCGALLAFTGSAFAQNYDNGRPHQTAPNHRPAHQQRPATNHRGPARPPQKYHGMYEQGHAEGWYRKGGRLPTAYRGNTYVVNNWNHYGLHRPPRGYHWVRSDNGQFLLVAVTTGIISSIVTSLMTH